MNAKTWVALSILLVALAAAAPARAQGVGAAISGVVLDNQGAVVPGATITARNTETGVARTVVSEADGGYRLAALPPATYRLSAELPGFSTTEINGLTLTIGLEVRQDFKLQISTIEEAVTVSAVAPEIEVTRADVSALITQEQITTLPIAGRSAITLALLLPGTSTDTTRAERPGANVGSGGITTAATNYIVDGLNNMISMAGDAREDVPQSAIQEFKVHAAQTPAEFGGRSGGVVNVVTKSGTNALSGEVFEFFRHKNLNALNLFEQQRHEQFGDKKPDFRRDQYGFSVGGPVVRNRAHFFVAIDRTREQQYFTVNTGKPQLYGAQEGTFEGGGFANLYFSKLDVQLTNSQHLSGRASRQDSTRFCLGCGGTSAAFTGTDNEVPGFTFYVGHTWLLSNHVVNEFAGLYAESNQTNPPGQYTPAPYTPEVGTPRYSFPSFSWGSRPGTAFQNPYYQVRDALSINAGRHLWKIGGGAQKLPTNITTPANELGTWTFGTDQYFNPSDPNFNVASLRDATQFQASFPTYSVHLLSQTFEAYAQDEWRIGTDITLNLGLRYDAQRKVLNEYFDQSRYPRPLPYVDFANRGDVNNFAPRAGVAWNVGGRAGTVVRAGYGKVFGNFQNAVARGEHEAFQSFSVTIRNPSYPDPYGGRDRRTFISTAPPNIEIVATDLENPETHVTSAGISQGIGGGLTLHADGIYSHTVKYPVGVQINTPDPVTRLRPFPEWGNIRQIQQLRDGAYDYRALLVRLQRRQSHNYLYSLAYTLAKQDVAWRTGTHYGTLTDQLHPEYDQGPTDNDRRHAFVASGSVLLPYDISLGAVWTLRSSRSFSAQAGRDLNGDSQNNDFVPGTTRNQGNRNLDLGLVNAWRAQNGLGPVSAGQIDSDRYNRFDVRVAKAVTLSGRRKVEFIGQVFNVLGTDNLAGVGAGWVTNALSDSFGRILEVQARQQAELAVRFAF